jgi:hypothetical protein
MPTIPAEFRPLLVESLLEGLRYAAEELVDAGLAVESYTEPLSVFDAVRATLDAIGWGARADVDVDKHRGALQHALTGRLETERHLRQSAELTPSEGAEQQREHAHRCALQIEAFMQHSGLEVPGDRNG